MKNFCQKIFECQKYFVPYTDTPIILCQKFNFPPSLPIPNPNLALALAPISQLLVLNPLSISMKPARLRYLTHSIYPNGSHFSALMLTSNEA